jgi:hypothetical protein
VTTPPAYTLARPSFPFPALAAFAGEGTLGRAREVGLALFMVARLARGMLPAAELPAPVRAARAAAARSWLASLALPAAGRVPLARAVDATGGEDRAAVAAALRHLLATVGARLDAAAAAELQLLAAALASEGP